VHVWLIAWDAFVFAASTNTPAPSLSQNSLKKHPMRRPSTWRCVLTSFLRLNRTLEAHSWNARSSPLRSQVFCIRIPSWFNIQYSMSKARLFERGTPCTPEYLIPGSPLISFLETPSLQTTSPPLSPKANFLPRWLSLMSLDDLTEVVVPLRNPRSRPRVSSWRGTIKSLKGLLTLGITHPSFSISARAVYWPLYECVSTILASSPCASKPIG